MITQEEILANSKKLQEYFIAESLVNETNRSEVSKMIKMNSRYTFGGFGYFEDETKTIHEITIEDYEILKKKLWFSTHSGKNELIEVLKSKMKENQS